MSRCKNCGNGIEYGTVQVGGVHMNCEQEYYHEKTESIFRVRPKSGGPWCVIDTNTLTDVVSESDEIYEVQYARISKAELEAMPDFEGW